MSNLLECLMVTSFKGVFMMSSSEIVNSRVGIGKYEVSNSPFSGVAGNHPRTND
jgi:hypothetical protein